MISLPKPSILKIEFEAVGCFFEFRGKILLLERLGDKPQGGTWGMQAGRLKNNENRRDGMIRELREETSRRNPKKISATSKQSL